MQLQRNLAPQDWSSRSAVPRVRQATSDSTGEVVRRMWCFRRLREMKSFCVTGGTDIGNAVHEFWKRGARKLDAMCISHSGRSASLSARLRRELGRGWGSFGRGQTTSCAGLALRGVPCVDRLHDDKGKGPAVGTRRGLFSSQPKGDRRPWASRDARVIR